jgi:hypothetical protein
MLMESVLRTVEEPPKNFQVRGDGDGSGAAFEAFRQTAYEAYAKEKNQLIRWNRTRAPRVNGRNAHAIALPAALSQASDGSVGVRLVFARLIAVASGIIPAHVRPFSGKGYKVDDE